MLHSRVQVNHTATPKVVEINDVRDPNMSLKWGKKNVARTFGCHQQTGYRILESNKPTLWFAISVWPQQNLVPRCCMLLTCQMLEACYPHYVVAMHWMPRRNNLCTSNSIRLTKPSVSDWKSGLSSTLLQKLGSIAEPIHMYRYDPVSMRKAPCLSIELELSASRGGCGMSASSRSRAPYKQL